jgi:lipopolysaccharide/colanic/teichoic acid biosynthesis glycosyltransferase
VSLALLVLIFPLLMWTLIRARLRGMRPLFERRAVLGQGGRQIMLPLLRADVTQRVLVRGLPALLSVVRGDMALVGPRPLPVEEAPEYRLWSGLLLAVKPGLTGPWRLVDSHASPEDRVLLDVWWIRNWSLWQHVFVLAQCGLAALSTGKHSRGLERWQGPAPTPRRAHPAMPS